MCSLPSLSDCLLSATLQTAQPERWHAIQHMSPCGITTCLTSSAASASESVQWPIYSLFALFTNLPRSLSAQRLVLHHYVLSCGVSVSALSHNAHLYLITLPMTRIFAVSCSPIVDCFQPDSIVLSNRLPCIGCIVREHLRIRCPAPTKLENGSALGLLMPATYDYKRVRSHIEVSFTKSLRSSSHYAIHYYFASWQSSDRAL